MDGWMAVAAEPTGKRTVAGKSQPLTPDNPDNLRVKSKPMDDCEYLSQPPSQRTAPSSRKANDALDRAECFVASSLHFS